MRNIKITGFKTFPEMREYANTNEGRERVYDDLCELTGNNVLGMDCSDLCELAQVGDTYVKSKFTVEIF